MRHGSLFSGIGGFDLAAEWMGWDNVFHCEWNPLGQKVLKHYFPKAISYEDITKTDFSIHRGEIDIITGGFPCQPYSSAGKRKGKEDERHLWPQMLRAIREIAPSWVVGENVYGLVNWSGGLVFHEVQADLEAEGYEVFPFLLPAISVNAPHKRNRIFFIAYAMQIRLQQCENRREVAGRQKKVCGQRSESSNGTEADGEVRNVTDPDCVGLRGQSNGIGESRFFGKVSKGSNWQNFPTQSPFCTRDDGISDRLDSITFPKWRNESIKAGGNAIVPQVVYQIFKTIEQYEILNNKHNPTH